MLLNDSIYGSFEITEPVLVDILSSPDILRLKELNQFGIPDKYNAFKGFSRYEHSIGVMLLLRKYGASLEEQLAGLIHDVSVLAFSHVTDWVFASGAEGIEDYHNSIHQEFLDSTDIPQILEKNGYDATPLLDEDNFPLLEKPIPNLCADRLDYSLREIHYWLNPPALESLLAGLSVIDAQFVFVNPQSARLFGNCFLDLQNKHWGSEKGVRRYYLLADILKQALSMDIISREDFYTSDTGIVEKLEICDVDSILTSLSNIKEAEPIGDSFEPVYKKFRYVDPFVYSDGKLDPLSVLDNTFKNKILEYRKINERGVLV